jgi:integrase
MAGSVSFSTDDYILDSVGLHAIFFPFGEQGKGKGSGKGQRISPFFIVSVSTCLDSKGKRYPYHQLRRMIHSHAKKVGITVSITPHAFRRSCATEMLRGGAGMYHIKEMLGHESLDTLTDYAKLTITDLKAAHAKCHPRENDGERASS